MSFPLVSKFIKAFYKKRLYNIILLTVKKEKFLFKNKRFVKLYKKSYYKKLKRKKNYKKRGIYKSFKLRRNKSYKTNYRKRTRNRSDSF